MARVYRLVDRRAWLVTIGCLLAWRLLNQIPIAGVTPAFVKVRLEGSAVPGVFGALGPNDVSLQAYSAGFLGIGPYVEALVIVSLLVVCFRPLRDAVRTPTGRVAIERWTRALALVLAGFAGYSWINLGLNTNPAAVAADTLSRGAMALEIAGGTAVMIWLAAALDEYGLGFGYGALIFYALGILALEVHRLFGYLASVASIDALYGPLAVWAAFTLGVTVAGVAVLLAYRRFPSKKEDEAAPAAPVKLMVAGVLRPGIFAFAVLALPANLAQMTSGLSGPLQSFAANWTAFGQNRWLNAVYIVTEVVIIVAGTIFFAAFDGYVFGASPALIRGRVRLGFIAGVFIGLTAAILVPLSHAVTKAAGYAFSFSAYDTLLVVTLVLLAVVWIEGRGRVSPLTTTPALLP